MCSFQPLELEMSTFKDSTSEDGKGSSETVVTRMNPRKPHRQSIQLKVLIPRGLTIYT